MVKTVERLGDVVSLKQELVEGAALVASIGLVPLTQGNLSCEILAVGMC